MPGFPLTALSGYQQWLKFLALRTVDIFCWAMKRSPVILMLCGIRNLYAYTLVSKNFEILGFCTAVLIVIFELFVAQSLYNAEKQ